ncbi:putative serine protease HtrA [bioreactor metagenome]|uniref:Putative serine protease HtrA n=1 Tax=bioreactor metagenome TaxID=1076179 RepID=A0A645FU62_9ZZZZ
MVKISNDGVNFGNGSGVLIDYDEILTCYHVVNGYSYFKINYNSRDKDVTCSVQDTAPSHDAAVLTPPDKNVKPVKIGDSDEVKVGDKVYVISCPEGEKNVVTEGEVLKTNSFINFRIGFEISPITKGGSSGGACFNAKGELIGIVQSGDDVSTFIVPINSIRQALAE